MSAKKAVFFIKIIFFITTFFSSYYYISQNCFGDNLTLNSKYFQSNNDLDYVSAIVVDANNGELLYSYHPDIKIYPASLTKIMTSYLVFNAIEQGVVGINDRLNRNSSLTIKDLLFKMTINSYNDITNILAEETYGNVQEFINTMNKTASEMKMTNTHFANTNGLFNESHYSTVRDIAKLTIRLVYDFPKYKNIFGITNYIDENSYYNVKTTKIQQNMQGIEGSKTGYIDASGYNLALWGHYYGRHIFLVISGVKSKENRDKVAIKLLDSVLQKIKKEQNKNEDIKQPQQSYINGNTVDKILDFIGIDYKQQTTPMPQIRSYNKNNDYFLKKSN